MKKHIEVVAGIIEDDGKILCMQRAKGKFDYVSFKWEFPGGKIENGETKKQALERELFEEMEMEIEIEKPFMDIFYEYEDFTIKMYTYLCKAKSKKFKMNVHNDFKWLEKKDLKTISWCLADEPIIDKLME